MHISRVEAIIVATAVLPTIATVYRYAVPRITREQQAMIADTLFYNEPAPVFQGNRLMNTREVWRNEYINCFNTVRLHLDDYP